MKHWRYTLALGAIFGVSFGAWAGQVPNPVNADNAIVAGHFLLGDGAQRATDSGWSLVPMANGGCNAALTPTANDLLYSTASACALLPTANNSILTSSGSGAPAWSTSLPAGIAIPSGDCPLPTTSSVGCVEAVNAIGHEWVAYVDTSGVFHLAQPAASDLSNGLTGSGSVVLASAPTISNLALSGSVSGNNTVPLSILAQQTTKCVLGNGTSSTGNITCAWTVANTTDTVIPLVHGTLTSGDDVCLNDAAGTLKDCGSALSGTSIPSGDVLGNNGGGPAIPNGVTLTSLFDTAFCNGEGSILYRGASGWACLGYGTAGQMLETQGASAAPQWVNGTWLLCRGNAALTMGSNTSETQLATCTVPAGALGANGCIDIETMWNFTNNSDTKAMFVRFNSTSGNLLSSGSWTTVASVGGWHSHVCNQNSANAQFGPSTSASWGNASTSSSAGVSLTVSTGSATTIYLDASQTASADDMALQLYEVWISPHS